MILYIILGIVALILAFVAVIVIRAAAFKPKSENRDDGTAIEFNRDEAVNDLRELVKCKTVSSYDKDKEDEAEFLKLIALLPKLYPSVIKNCELKKFDGRALLFRWKGKSADKPSVMMAHYDVVPVNESEWSKPPFDGIIEDGVLWGRGTLDTKVTFNGILFAAEHLMSKGFVPENDVYFAFSGSEEVMGEGAVKIVDYFKDSGIRPELVVDEGGAVVENVFPGVKGQCGLIGVAEKGMADVKYKVKSSGGHASAPKPHTPVGVLSRACCRVEKKPFPYHISKPVAEMFDSLGRRSTFLYRIIFANLWCFKGVLDKMCRKSGGELNALMRTTVAFTQMEGSKASNVIPPEAEMVSNVRLNPTDTLDGMLEYLNKTVGDDQVEITVLRGMNPSPVSRTDCSSYEKVACAVASTWKGAIVSPYLMVQCSDSRHYGKICDKVYRFSAMDLTKEERGTIHGNDERIRVECAARAAEFYIRLIGKC